MTSVVLIAIAVVALVLIGGLGRFAEAHREAARLIELERQRKASGKPLTRNMGEPEWDYTHGLYDDY